jgi:hypothetical protein
MNEHTVGRSLVIFLFGLEASFKDFPGPSHLLISLSLSLSLSQTLAAIGFDNDQTGFKFFSTLLCGHWGKKLFYSNVVMHILSHRQ